MKKIQFLFALLITASLFHSCQKEPLDGTLAKEAPALPAAQSFIMPFDAFENVDSAQTIDDRTVGTKGNIVFSALNVLVWQTVVNVTMAVPVATFGEAFNHDPVFIGNDTYEWKYNVRDGFKVYTCTLTGQLLNADNDVDWTMTVSLRNGFQDFVFYTGTTSNDGRTAVWNLNHEPNAPEAFLNIAYSGTSDNDFTIKYTNVKPNHPENGDFIEYRADATADFNRAYDVYQIEDDNFLEIQWDEPAGFGRVKNLKHFGDDNWHCWDENGDDTNC